MFLCRFLFYIRDMPTHSLIRGSRGRKQKMRWLPESLRRSLFHSFLGLVGGGVICFAILYALLLLTYNHADPSWNSMPQDSAPVHNWLGVVGSHIADIVWQFFGVASWLIALFMFAWGWSILKRRGLGILVWRVVAAFLALLSTGIALAVLFPHAAVTSPVWGGAFGKLIGNGLRSLLALEWWPISLAIVMLIIAVCSVYMASALTLGEWHAIMIFCQRMVRMAGKTLAGIYYSFLDFIANEKTNLRLPIRNENQDSDSDLDAYSDDADAETEDEDVKNRSKEDETVSSRRDKTEKSSKKRKGSLVQRPAASAKQARLALRNDGEHNLPPLELLQWPQNEQGRYAEISEEALEKNAKLLESVLSDFGVHGQIIKVSPGPVVTLYELEPSPGTRASRVISLADDIARNMSAASVRVAVVPGRNVIGIEMPNKKRETVYLRELLSSNAYSESSSILPLVLGKDIAGNPIIADLARMPHLLIAGTTGSGKSVAINTMILSLLYRLPPQKCRFIMIDPKMLELSVYEGIPHLLAPVVTEPKKAIMALKWTVREMEERYRAMSKLGVRNIEGYNVRLREAQKSGDTLMRTVQTGFDRETGKPIYEEQPLDLTPLPFIVVIVDEMADLMIVAGKEIEGAVQRLAQMARAAGIHILMATQRPSVDVITGTIKANFPTRISFQVTSKIDSRTILGEQGAEQLLGQGDMLYMAGGGRIMRVHGPFVRDDEVEKIVSFLKTQGEPEYLDDVTEGGEQDQISGGEGGDETSGGSGNELYDKAVDLVLRERKASISFVQRHLQIGYNRAATLIERMEREGIISSANHVGKREILGRSPEEN